MSANRSCIAQVFLIHGAALLGGFYIAIAVIAVAATWVARPRV